MSKPREKHFLHKLILLFGSSLALSACTIRVSENDNGWDEDWDEGQESPPTQEERAADVCDPYCIELIGCGALSDKAFVSCRSLCMDRFADHEAAVTSGTACVEAARCEPEAAQGCIGDPLPGVLDATPHGDLGAAGSRNGGDY